MLKVTPISNKRLIEDHDTDIVFEVGKDTILKDRNLKAGSIKRMLFDGILRVTEGSAQFQYKDALVTVSEKHPEKCICIIKGKEEEKVFDTNIKKEEKKGGKKKKKEE